MKLILKLRLFFLLMLALALSGAALSVWSGRQAGFYLDRIGLAHMVYEANLELSNHTYQLFKQFGDSLIIGDKDRGPDERNLLIGKIRQDIDRIRNLIGQEIELVGEEEIEELESLSRLEFQIESLFRELTEITSDSPRTDIARNWGRLSVILDGNIDQDFRTEIEAALKEEAEEARETRALVQDRLALYQSLSVLFAVLAGVIGLASLIVLRRSVQMPMMTLSEGAKRLSAGDMSHRIASTGNDEMAELARTLNHLADRVEAREKHLTSSNQKLEEKVSDRTARLETLLEETRKAESNRKRLMADVSHELRTPLTIIQGEADIALRGSKVPEDYRDALTRVREAATHTARLVDDLLFVARSETGEPRLKVREMDLLNLATAVAETNVLDMTIHTSLTSAPLQGDLERMRQVILILVENARHYGGEKIEIQLHREPDDSYRLSVADDGPGMTEEDKKNAFERFFRGSNAARRYSEGTGLGLPVARSIVQAHGGTVTLEDRPGGGLIASLVLPAKPMLKAVS